MTDPYTKLARLRELYPDDLDQIEAEQQRVRDLLERQDYSQQPTTKALVALCRREVMFARLKLATVRSLDEAARRELWGIIDARLWFIEQVSRNYAEELETIDRELEAELARA